MVYILRLGLLCSILIINAVRGCPNGWESFEGSCYFVPNMSEDWSAALSTCKLYHAHLAEIEDAYENNFLKQLVNKYHDAHSHGRMFWLGGSDSFVEGDWRWLENDERFGYTNWSPDEPDDNHEENCIAAVLSSSHLYWRDLECNDRNNFICESGEDTSGVVVG